MTISAQELRSRLAQLKRNVLRVDELMENERAKLGDHTLNPHSSMPREAVEPAAVLMPIILREDEPTVLFTKRADHLTRHAGQVSFPGGRLHVEDADLVATALRETEEEVGIRPMEVEIAGFLDVYETGTGYRILPVVGFVKPGFALAPDPREVEAIFEVPLSFLMNPDNHQRHVGIWSGRRREYYAMPYAGYYIWGATAGMLRNFYERIYAQEMTA